MGLATLELRPGVGLGPFTLGMPICEALAQAEQHRSLFESTHIKYCEQEPLQWDIVVAFPHLGFHLRFDPHSQRLRLVEVFDITRVQLRYATSIIGGPSAAATFARVYAVLGPTFPGSYDLERRIYTLVYPGLAVLFPIPAQYADCVVQRQAELPLEFPDGTTPVTSRVRLHAGSSGPLVGVAIPPPLPPGSLYQEEVQVELGGGLYFTVGGQTLHFGFSPQDVWAELGRPCSIFPKQVDTMFIHSAASPRPRSALCGDYVYSYSTRGLDVLFDGQSHGVKKFVLHTNFPGHADFNTYIKCNFVVLCPSWEGPEEERGSARLGGGQRGWCIAADTKWDQVQDMLGEGGRPAIQTRGSVNNPFGPTYVYGYRDIAFEVLRNGHIATVTLFQTREA